MSSKMISDYFQRHEILGIRLSRDADIRDAEVCLVEVSFTGGYRVSFKLLDGQTAHTHRYFAAINPGAEPILAADGMSLDAAARQQRLQHFLTTIEDRVAKVHKEQSILNIQPVGKSFLLYGKTRFDVLSDDGEGQLAIRILRPEGSSEAALAANDLLDGLYAGIIKPFQDSAE